MPKERVSYEEIKNSIWQFDLIFFKGDEFVSDIIRFFGKEAGECSHVGMVPTSEALNHPKIQPDKLYIWESIMSGRRGV